jgi:hypothetical protein
MVTPFFCRHCVYAAKALVPPAPFPPLAVELPDPEPPQAAANATVVAPAIRRAASRRGFVDMSIGSPKPPDLRVASDVPQSSL